MGCIESAIWKVAGMEDTTSNSGNTCGCPPPVPFEKLTIKPKYRTPLDRLGFPRKFCYCCSTRVASGFICLLSFLWAMIELQCVDKTMAALFPERNEAFKICKTIYLIICMGFLLSCGALLLGVAIRKQQPVLCFVWYAFIFNCIFILFVLATAIAAMVKLGEADQRQVFRVAFCIIWAIFFFYLLMVVNSYKLSTWYRTLGFGF